MKAFSVMRYAAISATLLGLLVLAAPAWSKTQREFVLSDTESNVGVETFLITGAEQPELAPGKWRVEKKTLHGGKQEGSELVIVDNGLLRFAVCPTRGMNIVSLDYHGDDDFRVGWRSPVVEVVHPKFIDLESRGGLGWLDGFNEWMCRCGVEFAGHPGKDSFTTNTGEKGELDLTLHGKIGNTPASRVTVSIDPKPPHRISVVGVVYERSFHGPKLRVTTEVSTEIGSPSLRVSDRVTNQSASPQEYQLIYHTNYGGPILQEGAHVIAAFDRLQPMNRHAAEHIDRWGAYAGPTDGFVEEVFLGDAAADENGKTSILLQNASGTRGASITWDVRQLPYATVWKYTSSEADGYVTGLEPGTSFPFNRSIERRFGRVPKLQPGESKDFSLSYEVHASGESVRRIRDRIEAIQGEHVRVVTMAPPVVSEPSESAD